MRKFSIIVICLLFFSYLAIIVFIKNSFNTTKIKNDINNILSTQIEEYNKHYSFQKKEITFSIKNSINLITFPNIKLIINNLDIKNVQYKDVLINTNIKKIEIKLNFLDFFKKKLVPTKIIINGINTTIENNKLPNFYLKKEIKKKIVKLDDNEISGVKDKLKNLLTSNDNKQEVEEGYKEIEIEEEVRYDLDNSKVKFMLIDLFKNIKIKELDLNKFPDLQFTNGIISFINNGTIQKELKNIFGNLNFINQKEYNFNLNFSLNNIRSYFNTKIKNNNNKYDIIVNIGNELNDKININYSGNDLFINDFEKIKADIILKAETKNFNSFIQWFISANSKYYYMFNYKKALLLQTNINKNINNYVLKDINIKGEDIDLNGNLNYLNNRNDLNINIKNINLDEFVINSVKSKNNTNYNNIKIFKIDNFDNLIEILSNNKNNQIKDTSIILNIDKMSKNNKNLINSNINLDIINGNYKVNNLLLNIDNGIEINTTTPQLKNDLYYNNLKIKGNDLSIITKYINLDKVINIKEFELNGNLIIHNNVIYLINYYIQETNNIETQNKNNINGHLEYSLNKNNQYMAIKLNADNINFNIENKKTKTLKEKFLWLNNLTNNNIFINLNINNLSYNNNNNINIKAKANYYSGYLNIYDIENINFNNFNNIKGDILIDIRKKNPTLNINLFAENIIYDLNLIDYVFNIEKYKNILTREEINKEIQDKYWINKLFSFPTWEEIDGKINLHADYFKINNTTLNNLNVNSNIENGVLNLNNLTFIGLGGSTELKGKIDLKTVRNLYLILTDTTYDIEDIFKLFTKTNHDEASGTIGIGGIIKAVGFNSEVFNSSINTSVRFISKNLFIKKLGLTKLKNDLKNIYSDNELLKTINAKEALLDNSGTLFNDVNGSFNIANGISNFIIEGKADGISNKLVSKIDNTSKNININMVNTSIIMNKVGNKNIPLYSVISFKEDFANKANLNIYTGQIEEYINKIRETKGIN